VGAVKLASLFRRKPEPVSAEEIYWRRLGARALTAEDLDRWNPPEPARRWLDRRRDEVSERSTGAAPIREERTVNGVTVENIVSRAEGLGFPAEPLGLKVADAPTWRAILATASDDKAREIVTNLNALEEKRAEEREEAERARRERVRAGLEPPNAEEQAEAARFAAEARADLERHERERPRRVEALLARIADGVAALAKR
jgi:hypothetical protein